MEKICPISILINSYRTGAIWVIRTLSWSKIIPKKSKEKSKNPKRKRKSKKPKSQKNPKRKKILGQPWYLFPEGKPSDIVCCLHYHLTLLYFLLLLIIVIVSCSYYYHDYDSLWLYCWLVLSEAFLPWSIFNKIACPFYQYLLLSHNTISSWKIPL